MTTLEVIEKLYTVPELAERSGYSERSIREFYSPRANPRLKAEYLGSSIRIKAAAWTNYLDERAAMNRPAGSCRYEMDDGTPCKNNAVSGSGYCYPHRSSNDNS